MIIKHNQGFKFIAKDLIKMLSLRKLGFEIDRIDKRRNKNLFL